MQWPNSCLILVTAFPTRLHWITGLHDAKFVSVTYEKLMQVLYSFNETDYYYYFAYSFIEDYVFEPVGKI